MANKIIAFIDRTLNTRITPLAYLVAVHSMLFGGAFVFLNNEASVRASLLFKAGVIDNVPLWGAIVFVSAVVLILGMAAKSVPPIQWGALGLFMGWLFAAITYAQNDLWFQMVLTIVTMLYFGYHFLASSLGRLWDYTP